ncbi:hypothetical protein ABEB36_006425 [Hypothenemus hampei]|uniref:Uncharacterized protein n=1 Tax=Hypothenemus hampei TaxID=57062 RepID=A0ABD1EQY0_HYPHA
MHKSSLERVKPKTGNNAGLDCEKLVCAVFDSDVPASKKKLFKRPGEDSNVCPALDVECSPPPSPPPPPHFTAFKTKSTRINFKIIIEQLEMEKRKGVWNGRDGVRRGPGGLEKRAVEPKSRIW